MFVFISNFKQDNDDNSSTTIKIMMLFVKLQDNDVNFNYKIMISILTLQDYDINSNSPR